MKPSARLRWWRRRLGWWCYPCHEPPEWVIGLWTMVFLWAFAVTVFSVHYVLSLFFENGHWIAGSLTCASYAVSLLGILYFAVGFRWGSGQ